MSRVDHRGGWCWSCKSPDYHRGHEYQRVGPCYNSGQSLGSAVSGSPWASSPRVNEAQSSRNYLVFSLMPALFKRADLSFDSYYLNFETSERIICIPHHIYRTSKGSPSTMDYFPVLITTKIGMPRAWRGAGPGGAGKVAYR